MTPRATYRLQFNRNFPFAAAAAQADYFAQLGISHIYASPILTARAGSLHGYDVVDHSRVNPELGGEDGFREMASRLRAHGIGIVVDIVPNHMAVGHADNAWWLDVLQHGGASAFATAFDIDWHAPGSDGRILAPFLGAPPETLLAKGELTLLRDKQLDKICFAYFDHRFPVRPQDQDALRHAELGQLDRVALLDLLTRQHFRLADWRQADRHINWRRFFDITELAALRMEHQPTFEAVHQKTFALYGEGLIDGLRVDHVDGLADPRAYCRALRQRLDALKAQRPDGGAGRPYILVEKILAEHETLPADWQCDGTTGYDFMNHISALLHADDGGALDAMWRHYGKRGSDFEIEELAARQEILATGFVAQFEATALAFAAVLPDGIDPGDMRDALTGVLVQLRCYRSYATGGADSPGPGPFLAQAMARAAAAAPRLAHAIAAIEAVFHRRDGAASCVDTIRRFNQLSAPSAAKAVEDTAFYRYGRLLSRNDVGFDPRLHRLDPAAFHALMVERAAKQPHSMLATATHDHKRGEDARARLAVLSESPELWHQTIERWFADNAAVRPAGLHSADEYQLYQTLLGLWPGERDTTIAAQRLEIWCEKFLREGKLRSSWQAPDLDYEGKFKTFATALLADRRAAAFAASMDRLLASIAPAAAVNAIVQAVLRCTLPGMPDLYQGCEYDDFSLVDPDNRGAVDFSARAASLTDAPPNLGHAPHAKQAAIARLLQTRRNRPALFAAGDYRALTILGRHAAHVLAFERRLGDGGLVVLAELHHARRIQSKTGSSWADTALDMSMMARPYIDLMTGENVTLRPGMPVAALLGDFPVKVLLERAIVPA
ncbi:MAG: malto-oligosyltrehalose synthase [Rhodospirillales bacterium]